MAAETVSIEDLGTREDLARALTGLREARGLTVREVAAAAEVPIATVGGYFSGRHLPPLAAMDQLLRVLDVLGVPADAQQAWVDAVTRLRRAPGRRPVDSPAPYRGLTAYQPEDAAVFVGREELTDALVRRVTGADAGPVVVIGPSGSGKSSLLRAGLVARLRQAGHAVAVVTPATIATEPTELASGAVLVVDQLEEVLAAQGRARAAALVAALVQAQGRGVRVVIALRADFFDRALELDPVPDWLADRPVLVPALSVADLRRVIVEPARSLGIEVEDALVDVLVAEATAGAPEGRALDAGALPLVSHALYVTWAATPGRRLTVAHYREAGGFAGAIAKTAEDVFTALTPAQQEVARRVMTRLVHVHEGVPDTRRPADQREFVSDEALEVLASCIDARLITSDRGRVQLAHDALINAWPRLRQWLDDDRHALRVAGRLTESVGHWLDGERSPDLLYRGTALESALALRAAADGGLTDAEREFLDASEAAELGRVRARRQTAQRLRLLSAGLAVAAVAALVFALGAVRQSGALARERDLAVSRQLAVTSRSLAATDPALAGQVALAATQVADTLEGRSALLSSTATTPVSRLADLGAIVNAVAVSPDGALLAVATEASTVELLAADDGSPVATLEVGDNPLYAATFSPDGRLLLAGGGTQELLAWDVTDPADPTPVPVGGDPLEATVYGIATDPGGELVAAATSSGGVHLWRVEGSALRALAAVDVFEGTVQDVEFVGDALAAAGSEGLLAVVDVTDPAAPAVLGAPVVAADGHIAALDLAPDGHTLAAASFDFAVHLWDLTDPAAPLEGAVLAGPTTWVNGVAFSPDGATVAGASSDKHTWTWDLETGRATRSLPDPASLISVAWAPDGTELFTGGLGEEVRVSAFPGPSVVGLGSISAQAPVQGTTMVTANRDGMRVWDVADPEAPVLVGHAVSPSDDLRLDGAVDFSARLGLVVAGTREGAALVWDIADPTEPELLGTMTAHDTWIELVDVDPSGRWAALGSDDGLISLWDLDAGLPAEPTSVIEDAGGMVYGVAFSPDSSLLAAAVHTASAVRLYDVSDPAAPVAVGEPLVTPDGYVYDATFSPDGRTLAASSADGTIWLWDVTTPAEPVLLGEPFRWADGYSRAIDFAPDGGFLAAAMTDGTVRVWDVTEPSAPVRWASLEGISGTLYGVDYWPDGARLSVGAPDRTVRVFGTGSAAAAARVCAAAGRGLAMTSGEWSQLAGSLPTPQQCG